MKQINFSRVFPAHHPRKGEATLFVEAILNQIGIDYTDTQYLQWLIDNNKRIKYDFLLKFWSNLSKSVTPKSHTIRRHKKPIKTGESFTPTCWAGSPYKKTKDGYWKIVFAPPIEVKKTWSFSIDMLSGEYRISGLRVDLKKLSIVAMNDGFVDCNDFERWFKIKRGEGLNADIICWNDKIQY